MLPHKPSYFDTELENIRRIDGKPFFRCVNPQTEKEFRCGKVRIKHQDHQNFCKPKNCWVIEYYQLPREINEVAWNNLRYRWLKVNGQDTWTDMLGEYPRNGRYVFMMDVVDEHGLPISPNSQIIADLTKRFKVFESAPNETPEEGARKIIAYTDEMEKEKVKKMTDQFFQMHGIAAQKAYNTVISKPLIVKPN